MSQAQEGSTVKVHYTGKFEDGTVFDSSTDRDPLKVELGAGNVIPGFEKGLIGMTAGDKKTLKIPSGEAYGDRTDELVVIVDKSNFPEDADPQVGQRLAMTLKDGNVAHVVVTAVEDEKVTLDANHPLAGRDLVFEVELVEVA